jgi:MOB kinase activator 1
MSWIQQTLDNGKDFPTKIGSLSVPFPSPFIYSHSEGQEFPPNFPTTAKQIYRQLLRVFAHIYHSHFPQLLHLQAEGHFNSLFAHFLAFGRQYDLVDVRDIKGRGGGEGGGVVGVGELWEKWREMGVLEG